MGHMNNNEDGRGHLGENCLLLRLKLSHKVAFLLGLILGVFVLRHQVLLSTSEYIVTNIIRGYEYDAENECIVVRKKNGKYDYCRPFIDCTMCSDVKQIEVVNADLMTYDLFEAKYAYSGRPVLVKNATNHWRAMQEFDFEFFRDLYEDLESPVLTNDDPDCQFFAWDFKEFGSIQEVFDMPDERWQMSGNYTPWYVGWANCDDEAGAILRDFYDTPDFLPAQTGRRDWIFIGTPGYGAPMHLDNVKYPSWQAQVHGVKSWALRPPPECWWSCYKEMSATMYPGDIIVVNTNWWYHSTKVLEDLSITITNEYQ